MSRHIAGPYTFDLAYRDDKDFYRRCLNEWQQNNRNRPRVTVRMFPEELHNAVSITGKAVSATVFSDGTNQVDLTFEYIEQKVTYIDVTVWCFHDF